jgi:hypothetical protein
VTQATQQAISMTWNTPDGPRVLGPAEGKLFAAPIATLIDFYRDHDDKNADISWGTPIIEGPFQRLNPKQVRTSY